MRIHSDKLTIGDFQDVIIGLHRVDASVRRHGSRTRKASYEARFTGNGALQRNTGHQNLTYDERGTVLARLYLIDPEMHVGTSKYPEYRSAAHFHAATGDRFADGRMPGDAHTMHYWRETWQFEQACTACTAVRRVS